MSESVAQRYENCQDLKLVWSNKNMSESQHPHRSQWMSHWMRTSCSAVSQVHKSCNAPDARHKEGHITEEARNMNSFDANLVRSSTLSRKLPGSSVDSENFATHHFLNSVNVSSEWQHFPMFDINRKIESILAPKKRSRYGAMSVGVTEPQLSVCESTFSPHEIEFASEDHQFQAQSMTKITDQQTRPYKSVEGLTLSSPYQDDLRESNSHSLAHRYKYHGPTMRSCNSTKEVTDPFSSLPPRKQHVVNTNDTHLQREPSNSSGHSTFMVSKMKSDNLMAAKSIGSSGSRLQNGSLQLLKDSWQGDICLPFLTGEHGKEIQNVSDSGLLPNHSSIPGLIKLEDFGHVNHLPHRIPNFPIHDVETLRICTTLDAVGDTTVGPQKLAKATKCFVITKKMGMNLSKGEMIRDSTVSSEVKGHSFFEMPTLPCALHCHGRPVARLQPLVNSTNGKDNEDRHGIDTGFMETQNELSVKTDTMYIDVCQSTSSPADVTSAKSQKGLMLHPNLKKSEATSISPIKQVISGNAEAELPDMNVEHHVSSETAGCMNVRELSTSKTESIDAEHILSHVEKPENLKSSSPLETSLGPEPSSRWVKRLRLNPSDSLALGTKSFKVGDDTSSGEVHKLFSRGLNCNRSSSNLANCLKEPQQFDKGKVLLKTRECPSGESLKEIQSWIRRWCHSSQQAAPCGERLAAPVLCEPENLKAVPGSFEGKQFASIEAMALMGKAISNFRPCKYRRRGSFVVWNTEDI